MILQQNNLSFLSTPNMFVLRSLVCTRATCKAVQGRTFGQFVSKPHAAALKKKLVIIGPYV